MSLVSPGDHEQAPREEAKEGKEEFCSSEEEASLPVQRIKQDPLFGQQGYIDEDYGSCRRNQGQQGSNE